MIYLQKKAAQFARAAQSAKTTLFSMFGRIKFQSPKVVAFGMVLGFLLLLGIACGPADSSERLPTVEQPGAGETNNTGYPVGDSALEGYPAFPAENGNPTVPPPLSPPAFPGRLMFHTERFGGGLQLALLDGATGTVTQFNQEFAQSMEPAWSPDCRELIFTIDTGGAVDFDLWRQPVDGGASSPFISSADLYNWSAAWSVNDIIAYQTNADARINICFADAGGNALGCLARDQFSNAMPVWSPQGDQLIFSSNRTGNWELYKVSYDDLTNVTQLTENLGSDYDPAFSPDGRLIAYASQRGGSYDIFIMGLNGENERQLTATGADARYPEWIADSQLVYSATFDEESDLYLINSDGTGLQQLTNAPGLDDWPAWCSGSE
jgi:Tol biopolymer transport system component